MKCVGIPDAGIIGAISDVKDGKDFTFNGAAFIDKYKNI